MNVENKITKDFFFEGKAKQEKNKEKPSVAYSSHSMMLKYQAEFSVGGNQYTSGEVHEATSLCTN